MTPSAPLSAWYRSPMRVRSTTQDGHVGVPAATRSRLSTSCPCASSSWITYWPRRPLPPVVTSFTLHGSDVRKLAHVLAHAALPRAPIDRRGDREILRGGADRLEERDLLDPLPPGALAAEQPPH